MAQYKGIEVADELVALVRHMDGVDQTREALQRLQGVWDNLAMLGQLSGTGVEIAGVRSAFSELTERLVNQLAGEARRKVAARLAGQAQVAIDILVRNLFERTADIGFLATDVDLRDYAECDAGRREVLRPALRERLRQYQRKYSVYQDIVLLDPQGTVLVRLGEGGPGATTAGFLAEALVTGNAYVESFQPLDLVPAAARSLVYAYRVMGTDGRRAVAVLCLVFRFDDECERIFRGLAAADDWSVLLLQDAGGRVIASSDALLVPPGITLPLPRAAGEGNDESGTSAEAEVMRFGGRRWLAAGCAAHPYQGYAGPGWFGRALLPLEHAFDAETAAASAAIPAALLPTLTASPLLFSDGLREIPRSAAGIEAELRRAVWNGNVALSVAAADRDSAFSKILLREIGQTGARTREVFTRAITDINHTVISAVLDDAAARAALAIDIMDRNLYERANDCRWWALTAAFRRVLETDPADAAGRAELGTILQTIHGLYTVYANLVLFDASGTVVAVSREADGIAPDTRLDAEWVARTLALPDPEAYAVSDFEPTALYGGQPTYVYTAAVRGLADTRRTVGGIAIVFDAKPQFDAMLADTLARDERGQPLEGAFNVFVDRRGDLLAHCAAGVPAAADALHDLLRAALAAGERSAGIVAWQGRLYAQGACLSAGYREYKGREDVYRNEVRALTFAALADADDAAARALPAFAHPEFARLPAALDAAARIDLATFLVSGQWYALAAGDVVEAVAAQRILPLPAAAPHVRGSVMHRGMPVLVIDLGVLLGSARAASAPAMTAQIVMLRPGAGRPAVGLLVDALGENPEVLRTDLDPFAGGGLVEQLVKSGNGRPVVDLLKVLSLPRLATAVFGTRNLVAAE